MSEILFKMCGIALVSAMLIAAIRKGNAEIAVLLKVISGVVLAAVAISSISPVVEFVRSLSAIGDGQLLGYAEFLLRVLCIALLTHICATVCRDCGEASLSGYLELGGKVEIIILTLPYISGIIDTAVGMM